MLVTVVNSTGNMIPSIFLFQRKLFEKFVANGLPGCIGPANQASLMNSEYFLEFLEHFVRHIRCTVDRSVLLLLDNHESYFSATGNDFANSHGVLIL